MEQRGTGWIGITREVSPEIEHCELTFLERGAIDFNRAVTQHEAYCHLLEALGIKVIRLKAAPGCPDSCFVEDPAVVLDEIAVITMLGAASRRPESPGIAEALSPYRKLATMALPQTLDGGDLLRIDRRLFVGLTARTNEGGVKFMKDIATPLGYEVIPLEPKGCLHLKSAVTHLGDGRVIANKEWIDPRPFTGLEVLPVPREEPWGANVLEVRGEIVVHSGHPRTIRLLEKEGLRVKALDVSEFLKAEAGLTCKSLIFQLVPGI
jgi:dimethylargininase